MRISDWSSDVCSSDLQSKPLGIGHALFRACYGDGRRMDIGLLAALVDDAHRRDFIVHRPAAARVDAARIAPSTRVEIAAIFARCTNRKPMPTDRNLLADLFSGVSPPPQTATPLGHNTLPPQL